MVRTQDLGLMEIMMGHEVRQLREGGGRVRGGGEKGGRGKKGR